jgi:two-component system LytT family response regulator
MKVLLVDDEAKARSVLTTHLSELDKGIEIVAEANNVAEAVKAILKYEPELVFLDVEMPVQDGFKLFNYLDEINFQVIFVTGSRDHAIEAFKVSALDYILKPIDRSELSQAVEKAICSHSVKISERLDLLKEKVHSSDKLNRIALSTSDSIEFVALEEIIYLKADGPYTEFNMLNGNTVVVSRSLGEFSFLEEQPGFLKTHRSFIVNLEQVQRYQKEDGGAIVMQNGDSVSLSRYRKDLFLQKMQLI